MATEVVIPGRQKKGGLFGKIAGLAGPAIGLGLAPFTGGASIAPGVAIGQAAKGVADATEGRGSPLEAAMGVAGLAAQGATSGKKKPPGGLPDVAKKNAGVQELQLQNARVAAAALPKSQQDEVLPIVDQGLEIARRNRELLRRG